MNNQRKLKKSECINKLEGFLYRGKLLNFEINPFLYRLPIILLL